MNARSIHSLVRKRLPVLVESALDWINIADSCGVLQTERLAPLIEAQFGQGPLIAYANRQLAAVIEASQVEEFIGKALFQHRILLVSMTWKQAVVIGSNGVAAAWHMDSFKDEGEQREPAGR